MNFAFLVNNLGANQLAYQLISAINQDIKTNGQNDISVFYENQVVPATTLGFMTGNIADAWSYKGTMIATSLSSTHKILNFPNATQKIFYVFDLEWLYIPKKNFEALAEVYENPNITLITRSELYASKIQEAWNRKKVYVASDFNIQNLEEIIHETSRKN